MPNPFVSISTIDGVRASVTDTGWFLVRASNTSPYLSVRVEGVDRTEAECMLDIVAAILGRFDFVDLTGLHRADLYVS